MPGMAGCARADRAIAVWSAHTVALLTAAGHSGCAFELRDHIRRPASCSGLKLLGKINLFGRETFFSVYGCPCGGGVPAVQELLIDRFVTAAAVSRSEFRGNNKSVMVLLILSGCGLMAIETVDALAGVAA